MKPVNIGLIGCGNISSAYLNAASRFNNIRIVACADLSQQNARQTASTYGIDLLEVSALLESDNIKIVLNLTPPDSHADINLEAVRAGKHTYCEKPFALNLEAGKHVLEEAGKKGLLVGCAPDTFLGVGQQTGRFHLDAGIIGEPVAATINMMNHGPDSWHPNPFFYYQEGGGPLLDMGPYYLSSLVNLLGPVVQVSGMGTNSPVKRFAGHADI